MSALRIYLFGCARLAHERSQPSVELTHMLQGLLGYLALQRHRSHPREVLAGLFWGEQTEEQARNCLNTALWRLRRVLEPEGTTRGTYLVTAPGGEVGFNCQSDYWLDVAIFEDQAHKALAHPIHAMEPSTVADLEHGLALCEGELLEGFYDDWALRERERLRMLYLNSLACLMRYYEHRGGIDESVAHGQRILHHDPLREEIHRDIMRLHLKSGRRALAIAQYQHCREILATELGIPPMEETQALYAEIVPAADRQREEPGSLTASLTREQALQPLRLALERLDNARHQLTRAIDAVARLTEGSN